MAEERNIIIVFVTAPDDICNEELSVILDKVIPDMVSWGEEYDVLVRVHTVLWAETSSARHQGNHDEVLNVLQPALSRGEMPMFINLLCPDDDNQLVWPDERLADRYAQKYKFTSTDIELAHSIYQLSNSNALYLLRQTTGENAKAAPLDCDNIYIYDWFCQDAHARFKNKVLRLLRMRMDDILCSRRQRQDSPLLRMKLQQDYNISWCSRGYCGMEEWLYRIDSYVRAENTSGAPLIVVSESGCGKTSLLAKSVHRQRAGLNQGGNNSMEKNAQIFSHFVGGTPDSQCLGDVVQRLLVETGVTTAESSVQDLSSLCYQCNTYLADDETPFTLIYVDGIEQFTTNREVSVISWLPKRLGKNVRVIISVTKGTKEHDILLGAKRQLRPLFLPRMDHVTKKLVLEKLMMPDDRPLSAGQVDALLQKRASSNPLWLTLAYAHLSSDLLEADDISDRIAELPDELIDLMEHMLCDLESCEHGPLVVAILCALVASRTGLTKQELHDILTMGDLQPPSPYSEKDETESSEKECQCPTATTSYAIGEGQWRGAYRRVLVILRPHNQSLTGRLSLRHSAIRQAICRRYFRMGVDDGTEDEGAYCKRWWHQKLADYFHKLPGARIERKVEELPHHLVYLNDEERVIACLCDWSVFDLLYDEEHSTILLFYWRRSDNSLLVSSYLESLKILEEEESSDRFLIAYRYEQVARVFLQCGCYADAMELAKSSVKLEEKELGSRSDRLANLYSLLSEIYDERLKLHDFVSPTQLPDLRKTISCGRRSIDLREKLPGDRHKLKLAMSLMKLAFSLDNWEACGADAHMTGADAVREGNRHIKRALKIFTELKDVSHLAEALMTKGVLAKRGSTRQLKYYNQAMEICHQLYGEHHVLVSRLYINIGIVYEDKHNYLKAYTYFKNWARVTEEVLGSNHPKTIRARGVLNEKRYKQIADTLQQVGNDISDNSVKDLSCCDESDGDATNSDNDSQSSSDDDDDDDDDDSSSDDQSSRPFREISIRLRDIDLDS